MKFKGIPGLTVTDGENSVEFPHNGILELKGKQAKWLKGLIESGKLKGVKVLEEQEVKPEKEDDKG
ncbi:hypothetical protein [Desulfurobacterium sp.]